MNINQARQNIELQYLQNKIQLDKQYQEQKNSLVKQGKDISRQGLSGIEKQKQDALERVRTQEQQKVGLSLLPGYQGVGINVSAIRGDIESQSQKAQVGIDSDVKVKVDSAVKELDTDYNSGLKELDNSRVEAHDEISKEETRINLENLQNQSKFDGSHVKLENGEFVNVDDFAKLGGAEQEFLKKNGVNAFNNRSGKEIFEQAKKDGKFASDEEFGGYNEKTGVVTGIKKTIATVKKEDTGIKENDIVSTVKESYPQTSDEAFAQGKNQGLIPNNAVLESYDSNTGLLKYSINGTDYNKFDVVYDENKSGQRIVLPKGFIGPPTPYEVRQEDVVMSPQTKRQEEVKAFKQGWAEVFNNIKDFAQKEVEWIKGGMKLPSYTQDELEGMYKARQESSVIDRLLGKHEMVIKGEDGRYSIAVAGDAPAIGVGKLAKIANIAETAEALSVAKAVKINMKWDNVLAEAETAQGKAILNQYKPTNEQLIRLNKQIAEIDPPPVIRKEEISQLSPEQVKIVKSNWQKEMDRVAKEGEENLRKSIERINIERANKVELDDKLAYASAKSQRYTRSSRIQRASDIEEQDRIKEFAKINQVSDLPIEVTKVTLKPGTITKETPGIFTRVKPERPSTGLLEAKIVPEENGTISFKNIQTNQVIGNVEPIEGINQLEQIRLITQPQYNLAVKIASLELAKNELLGLEENKSQALTQTIVANAVKQGEYPVNESKVVPINQLNLSPEEMEFVQLTTGTAIKIHEQIKNDVRLKTAQREKVKQENLTEPKSIVSEQSLVKPQIRVKKDVNINEKNINVKNTNTGNKIEPKEFDFSGLSKKRKKDEEQGFAFTKKTGTPFYETLGIRPGRSVGGSIVKKRLSPSYGESDNSNRDRNIRKGDVNEEIELSSAIDDSKGEVPIGTNKVNERGKVEKKLSGGVAGNSIKYNERDFIAGHYKGKYQQEKEKRRLTNLGGNV